MDIQEFYRLQENPKLLNKDTLLHLEQLLKEYSYVENIRILYALNLLTTNDYRYQKSLVQAAFFASDRKQLKYWVDFLTKKEDQEKDLESEKPEVIEDIQEITEDKVNKKELEQESDQQTDEYEKEQKKKALKSKSALLKLVKKRLAEIESDKKEVDNKSDDQKKRKKDLTKEQIVDQFIQNEPRISRPDKKEFYDPMNTAINSTTDEDDFFVTETLAIIHVDQGNIKKAIEIYRKLILKNPQKSSYFASRIEELNKK